MAIIFNSEAKEAEYLVYDATQLTQNINYNLAQKNDTNLVLYCGSTTLKLPITDPFIPRFLDLLMQYINERVDIARYQDIEDKKAFVMACIQEKLC